MSSDEQVKLIHGHGGQVIVADIDESTDPPLIYQIVRLDVQALDAIRAIVKEELEKAK